MVSHHQLAESFPFCFANQSLMGKNPRKILFFTSTETNYFVMDSLPNNELFPQFFRQHKKASMLK